MTTFTITGADLHNAANWAARIAPARPAIPTLGGALIDAGSDQIAVTCFDYETCGSVTVPADVTEPGRVLVSARLLAAIAKTVAKATAVTITVAGDTATVRSGRSEWSLPTMPVDEFPGLPELGEPVGEVDAEELRRALTRVLPALDATGDLPVLAGVKLDADADGLTLVATDRYRVATTQLAWKATGTDPVDALVPADLLKAAANAGGASMVTVYAGESTFGLQTDTHKIVGRQIAAQYPDLSRVMPTPGDHFAVIDVADLARAVDETMVMLDKEPILRLEFGADAVDVSAVGEGRSARASSIVHELAGEPLVTALNAGYLRTALGLLESDAAVLYFDGRTVLAMPSDNTGNVLDGYSHLVMKMRLPS
jgi:DNA polymerase-3 subunit beta